MPPGARKSEIEPELLVLEEQLRHSSSRLVIYDNKLRKVFYG